MSVLTKHVGHVVKRPWCDERKKEEYRGGLLLGTGSDEFFVFLFTVLLIQVDQQI
jgi:hypothetical protein